MTYNLEFISFLRKVMIDATTKIQLQQDVTDVPTAMAERLKFEKPSYWMAFGSCLYTFEDAAMAIRGYFTSARHSNEKDFEYLRLFGFLNAVWLQLGALKKLCEVVKLENKNMQINKLREHELIRCRNMLGSHTVDYEADGQVQSITIHQGALGGTKATFMVNETGKRITQRFDELFETWEQDTKEVLVLIIKKFVCTAYKANSEKRKEYCGQLKALLDGSGQQTEFSLLHRT